MANGAWVASPQDGAFRIYIGAAAGVGKTIAMLDEGRRRAAEGTDVVAGLIETHGRALTAERMGQLEVVPRRTVSYRGASFEEMDLDAVLSRRPAVALVDELAHTNVPGSGRNPKRWQDVLELLAAGIEVVTTVNIQHLESIADAVERMTGTPVRERVPDWVVRRADQIELIDSSPGQLRRRMLHGNIYSPAKVPDALAHFFRNENLTALRELALRFVADETEEDLVAYLAARQEAETDSNSGERLMVAVVPVEGTDGVIRRAARLAVRVKGKLEAVHVTQTGRTSDPALGPLQRLADDLGAEWHELVDDDPARALVQFARDNRITQIVLGGSRRTRWEHLGRGSVVRHILRSAAQSGIDVHVITRLGPSGASTRHGRPEARVTSDAS